jgi:hypothetical protein
MCWYDVLTMQFRMLRVLGRAASASTECYEMGDFTEHLLR